MIRRIPGVEYITRKTMLNPSKIEWVERCCNHYIGCAHGCTYPCYARVISRRSPISWAQVGVAENVLELIKAEIPKLRADHLDSEEILLSSMSDPYQPLEQELKLTRRILKILIKENMRFRILTKSGLVERDYELLTKARDAKIGFTFITLEDRIRKTWEPGADPIHERMEALIRAHVNYALPTFVSMEPIILGVTKPLEILATLKDYVDFWIFGAHNYAPRKLQHYYQPLRKKLIDYCEEQGLSYLIKKELREIQLKEKSYQMKLKGFGQY